MNEFLKSIRIPIYANVAPLVVLVVSCICCGTSSAQEQISPISMLPVLDRDEHPLPSDAFGPDSTLQLLGSLHKNHIRTDACDSIFGDSITIGHGNLIERTNHWLRQPIPTMPASHSRPPKAQQETKHLDSKVVVQAIRIKGLHDNPGTQGNSPLDTKPAHLNPAEIVPRIQLQIPKMPVHSRTDLRLASYQPNVNLDLNCAYAIESNQQVVQAWIDRVFGKASKLNRETNFAISEQIDLKAGEDSKEIIQSLATMFNRTYSIEMSPKTIVEKDKSSSELDTMVFDMIRRHSARVVRDDTAVFSLDSKMVFETHGATESSDVTTDAIRRLSEYQRGAHPNRSWTPALDEISVGSQRSSAVPVAGLRERVRADYSATKIVIACVWLTIILWIIYGAILARPAEE